MTDLLDRATTLLDEAQLPQGALAHAPSGLHLLRYAAPTAQTATLYRPLLCLVLQGAKQVSTGTRSLTVTQGQSLIVSHALPVVSRITEATVETPYLALVLPLDLDLLRGLAPAVPPARVPRHADPFSITRCPTDRGMEDALARLIDQSRCDETRQMLAPITRQELHGRLLLGAHADALQRLLWHETAASRIFRATREIQSDLSRTLVVGELAQRVGMSPSAFFEHFRAITCTSPLQYQKELRLLNARDALRSSDAKVSDVAFRVGYESPAQFSRDYSRKFGRSPRQDRVALAAE
ncbi:AraC family transcriptional regulator [Pararhodobacter marinus]|uniref:AraC family transcriptional regulator n=1 Tax=Pararhodobacter marinus TaxID=2184063 RepID=A0A2U2C9R3_9RHOB|nr:AraC family transcriptional regulator [Pararhodobacter marinus]PWE28591.1 AraC family transcriptional regulator [Pararhodobacter marinus]